MINQTYSLILKTDELEEKIEELENSQNSSSSSVNCINFSKSFSNLAIITSKKIELATASIESNSSIYLQLQIEISVPSSEKVYFSLYVDDICIKKSTRTLSSGETEVTIMQDYTSIMSQDVTFYLEIQPVDEKIIYLQSTNLFVWGIVGENSLVKYQIVPYDENLFVSFIDNGQIYYKIITFENSSLCYDDFDVLDSAIDFSVINFSGEIIIFKVDSEGNLSSFVYNKLGSNFYLSGAEKVSVCHSDDMILVSFIKNGDCYAFTISDNISSNTAKIYNTSKDITDVYAFYSQCNAKFFINITINNKDNFLIESLSEKTCSALHITSKFAVQVLLGEYDDEV